MTDKEFLYRIWAAGINFAELQKPSQKAEIVALKKIIAFVLSEYNYHDAEIAELIGTSRNRVSELRHEVSTASDKSRRLLKSWYYRIFT